MKKIDFKKMLGMAALCLGLNSFADAQCNANYTYTVGSSGTVNFTNTSTGTHGTPSYSWIFGDGTNSHTASPSHAYQYNGTYYANLLVTDTTGNCFDSISNVITITNASTCNLAAGFSYSAGSAGQINFTNTSSSVPSGATYAWNFGDGANSNSVTPSHIYNYNGNYTVQLYVSDPTGLCTSTISQTVNVSNGSICNLNVSYTYTLGANGQVAFTNTSTGVDTSIDRITWYLGDGNYSNSSPNLTHVYSYNGIYYVNLMIGDSTNICHGTLIDTISITNAATAPLCGAHFTDSLFAAGNVLFVNQSFGTTTNTHYYWSFGDGGSTSTSMNPSFSYSVNGVYAVTLSISDSSTGCSGSYTDSVTITNVTPVCMPSVSFMMHKDSLNPQPGVWEISPYYSPQVTSAIWYWGDGSSTNGLYPTHTYAAAGQYTIRVTVFSNCGDSSTTYQNDSLYRLASNNNTNGTNSMIQVTVVNATTGISQYSNLNTNISVYPNPSTGMFTLNLTNVLATKAQINITNILGETVYTTQEPVTNNILTKAIDLQNMANGAYFIKVMVGEKYYSNKLIINK